MRKEYQHSSPCVTKTPKLLLNFIKREQQLKWLALALGILSTVAIVQNWYPYTMFIALPFCLIWVFCAWIHTERQLKYINIVFTLLYVYGIVKYFIGESL